jgi:two-component system response regulator HydG
MEPHPPEVVCVLDDEPSVLKAIGRLLESVGIAVKGFTRPQLFLDYARKEKVRVAVIDVRMDGLTGLEVQTLLTEISPSTRVIIITGQPDKKTCAEALNAGAIAFFKKPFDDNEFIAAVRHALDAPDALTSS